MKKFVLLLAAAVALSASAFNMTTTGIRQVNKKATIHTDRVVSNVVKASKEMKQVQHFNSAVIDQQPEGELKTYNREGGAFTYDSYYGLSIGYQSGKAYIVFGEGNKVYLKDPVYGLQYGTWVEGTLSEDGTKITVPLGQTMYAPEGQDYEMLLSWGSTTYEYPEDGDGETVTIKFKKDERVTEAVYTINGDVITLEGTEGDLDQDFPEYCVMTGLCGTWSDDNTWQGCLDFGTTYTLRENAVVPTVITEQPEGRLVEYMRTGEGITNSLFGMGLVEQEGKAYVVYGDDGKVYLKDPIYGAITENWVEGTIEGNTITIPTGQCTYWSDANEYGMAMYMVDFAVDGDGYIDAVVDERATEITYTIDGNTISLNDSYGDMSIGFPAEYRGPAYIWTDDDSFSGYMDWNTVYTELIIAPAVPADPRLDEEATGYAEAWYDCGNEGGYSKLYHKFIYEDVDGNPIDADHLTFSIFTDDEQLFTFDYATYGGNNDIFTDDMTEIPCNYTDYDFGSQSTYFYRTNAAGYDRFFNQRIGIQVYYDVDGVKNASNIVWYYLPTYAENGVPANPTADEWVDCGDESGFSKFYYTIDEYTTDGERMDPQRMYYSIFTDDDQLFVFDGMDYWFDLDEDEQIELVPYTMSGTDIHNYYSYFYRTNAEGFDPFFNHQIGIQVYYMQADGTMTASDIVYLEVFEPVTAVDEVATGKTVAGVRYFNMAGQEMSSANGICIAVTTYTDGTTSAVKVVK